MKRFEVALTIIAFILLMAAGLVLVLVMARIGALSPYPV